VSINCADVPVILPAKVEFPDLVIFKTSPPSALASLLSVLAVNLNSSDTFIILNTLSSVPSSVSFKIISGSFASIVNVFPVCFIVPAKIALAPFKTKGVVSNALLTEVLKLKS